MEIRDLESKLTPAAKQSLDELLAEHRRRVLFAAAQSASRLTGDVREISVQDIVASWTADNIGPRRKVIDVLLRSYILGGSLFSAGALAFLSARDVLTKLDQNARFAFVLAFSGAVMALLSLATDYVRRRRPIIDVRSLSTSTPDSPNEFLMFLNVWQRLELAIRNKVAQTSGESTANKPLSLLLNDLQHEGVISVNDVANLKRIVEIRNRIVHMGPSVPPSELRDVVSDTGRLLDKIESPTRSVGSRDAG